MEHTCLYCKNLFRNKREIAKYCSRKCFHLSIIGRPSPIKGRISPNKGKPMSEKQKQKISQTRIQRLAEGKIIPPSLGKKMSEATKRKIGDKNRGKKRSEADKLKLKMSSPHTSGKKHPQWKGGKQPQVCNFCGETFYANTIYQIKKGRGKFCNHKCAGFAKDNKGEHNHWWDGGVMHHQKYRLILQPNHPRARKSGYVPEHTLVMEKMIGRFLLPQEVVHHKNRIRDDNREENLQLFSNNHIHLKSTLFNL